MCAKKKKKAELAYLMMPLVLKPVITEGKQHCVLFYCSLSDIPARPHNKSTFLPTCSPAHRYTYHRTLIIVLI